LKITYDCTGAVWGAIVHYEDMKTLIQ